jgi:spermidine synthase
VVLIDLPDPNNPSLGKLYSREFYTLLQQRMTPGGYAATQSSSPYYAPEAFWCIHHTMEAALGPVAPYFSHIPSFGGIWGFNLALAPGPQKGAPISEHAKGPRRHPGNNRVTADSARVSATDSTAELGRRQSISTRLLPRLRKALKRQEGRLELQYLDEKGLKRYFQAAPDYREVPTAVNTLNSQKLVQYYLESWRKWR